MFFFSFSILSLKTVVFIRFKDHSLHSIDLTGCCILGEEHIILSIALCSGGVFSLRIALNVPQPRLTLSLSHLHIYIIFILLLFVIRTIKFDHLFYPYFYIVSGLSLLLTKTNNINTIYYFLYLEKD